ncbi:MAG: aminopeptidase [Planctomycetes bacterium]|nr:aminopeptidase [Planctomycetota bacterium]
MRRRRRWVLGSALAAIGATCLLPGCSVAYVCHVGWGQARLLWARRPIREVLAQGGGAPERLRRLALVPEVKAFGESLGLVPGGSYEDFVDTGGSPTCWNLTACPRDSLAPRTWWFPIVGRVPYLGYFDRDRAEAQRRRLEVEGLDTYLRPVSAYSTLGWFRDPVYSSMLDYDEADLAEVVLHEMTHATVFVKDQVDFNETLASYVGREAALAWLAQRHGDPSPAVEAWHSRRRDEARFDAFLDEACAGLESLYGRGLAPEELGRAREEAFAQVRARFEAMRGGFEADDHSWFAGAPLNNALLASLRVYRAGGGLFERLHREVCGGDLRLAIARLREVPARGDARAWLQGLVEGAR